MFTKTLKSFEILSDQPYRQPVRYNITHNWRQTKIIIFVYYTLKDIFDAILYLLKTGCQWRMLPSDFPKWKFERMAKIYADGGYRGELVDNVKNKFGYDMEITLRTDKEVDFKPLPKRWIVERSFSWFENFRRLAKDYERTCISSENMIHLAFIALIINNL